MAEVFVVKCPDCDQAHRVGEQHRGKRIKCRGCEKVIAIPEAASAEEPKAKSAPAAKRETPKRKAAKSSGDENPYAAFDDDGGYSDGGGDVSDEVIDELRKTKPWVRLVGFLSAIGLILSAVLVAISAFAATSNPLGGPGFAGIGTIVVQGIGLLIYFLVAKFLIGYSRSIGQLEESGSTEDLVSALADQRRFWLLQGILIIVILGFGLIAALFAIFLQVAPTA
ncbi:MAG: hypothetical protein AB8G99_06345 [Planctomycetaceae bacterium]